MESRSARAARLSPGARLGLRIAGVTLLVIGACSILAAPILFLGGMADFLNSDAPGFPPRILWGIAVFTIGGACLVPGFIMTGIGFASVASEVHATELERAHQHMAKSFGSGLREGFGTGIGVPGSAALIRVRCLGCKALAAEDAKFCANCGAPMDSR